MGATPIAASRMVVASDARNQPAAMVLVATPIAASRMAVTMDAQNVRSTLVALWQRRRSGTVFVRAQLLRSRHANTISSTQMARLQYSPKLHSRKYYHRHQNTSIM